MADQKPQGLLSFAYNAAYDPATNKAIREDLEGVMSEFNLSPQAKTCIRTAQQRGEPADEDIEEFTSLLAAELKEGYTILYKDVW
jgi:hypothetical protein